jgi:hypothetical protein
MKKKHPIQLQIGEEEIIGKIKQWLTWHSFSFHTEIKLIERVPIESPSSSPGIFNTIGVAIWERWRIEIKSFRIASIIIFMLLIGSYLLGRRSNGEMD